MRLANGILVFCLAIAAFTAAAKLAAFVVIGLALLRPLETIKLLAALALFGLVARYPIAAILTFGLVCLTPKLLRTAD